MKELAIAIMFTVCMFYGFSEDSGWAFFGAVICLLSLT
jgi:hypothetical protein